MKHLQNIPAFKFALIFIIGILIGSYSIINYQLSIIIIVFLIIVTIFFYNKKSNIGLLTSSLIIVFFGILKSNIDFFIIAGDSIKYIPDTPRKSNIELIGIIKDLPDVDSNRVRFVVECNELLVQKDTIIISGDVIVTVRKDMFGDKEILQPILEVGDKISLIGKLSDPTGQRNPGEFDYRRYLALHNISKTFIVFGYKNVKVIAKNNLNFFEQNILYPAKIFALNNIDKYMQGDEAAYLKGLVTGDRSDISSEMKDAFVDAGVMHLIAVSGLNVAYIIIFVTLILSLFRIPLVPRTILTIIVLIFYCLFTDSPASIVRATTMGILVLLALLLERKVNFYNIIGVAAIIVLSFDSKQLFDAGFILSFSAVLSMAILFGIFEKTFIKKISEWKIKGKKITLAVAALFFTTLAAQIGTIPITTIYFGKISIISLLANVVVVPIANLSLAIGFFQIIAATASDFLSSIIAETNNIILTAQIFFIKWCASFNFAYVNVLNFTSMEMLCYYLILLLLITIKEKREIFFRILLSFLILTGAYLYNCDFNKKLRVTYLDIGQGDCAVIQTPDEKTILVDCGTLTFNYNSGERTIAPYLKRNGIAKIDLIIITHLHNDHIGGLNYLLENFKVGKIIESGQKFETQFIYKMDSIILNKKIPRETIRSGDFITDIENIRLYFLFPTNRFVTEDGHTINNNLNNGSVAFILKYKDMEFLFSGDIEKEGERFLYDSYSDFLKSDVLKVAHHGSLTSTTIPFIIKNKPHYAIVSCGMLNKFNHPSDIVLNRLENIGSNIFRTDLEGAVILESDGNEIKVINWK